MRTWRMVDENRVIFAGKIYLGTEHQTQTEKMSRKHNENVVFKLLNMINLLLVDSARFKRTDIQMNPNEAYKGTSINLFCRHKLGFDKIYFGRVTAMDCG